jgi:flavin reductase (DIM6/NTAB) family NADH-FMN oxidoreductase RutF
MEFDVQSLPRTDRYKLLIGGVVPRPIAFVATVSVDGRVNLAPFSFFTAIGSDPMMLMFCPANREDGSEKDTLRNAKPVSEGGTGEFVVNIVPVGIAEQMAACATELPYGESEFAFSGLTPAPSAKVRPPRVAECPISYECVTERVIRTNPGAPAGGNIVMGRVVHVRVLDEAINQRFHLDPAVLDALGRMGGPRGYCTTRDRLEVARGDEKSAGSGG